MKSIFNNFSLTFLTLTLAMAIVGCNKAGTGDGDGSNKDSGTSGDTANVDKKDRVIAFVTNQQASFWDIAEVGCQDAAKDFGVQVEVRKPTEATVTIQKQKVEDLLTSGISALAISPIDAENQRAMVDEWAAKIPLITHDSDAPKSQRMMFIGVDNYLAGRTVGKLIKDSYPDGAKMVLTIGRLEQDNAQLRRQGVIDELMDREIDPTRRDAFDAEVKNDKFIIYATLTDQGSASIAKQKAEDALNTYPDMNLFVGLFAYNPPACLQAIKQGNFLDKVRVAGFDEDDATLQGIKDGHVIGTVVQNPYEYGYQSVRILNEILDGKTDVIPEGKYLEVPARAVTRDGRDLYGTPSENVDDFWTDLKTKTGK